MRELRLRTSLALLMVVTTAATFLVVGSGILLARLPQIEIRTLAALKDRANEAVRLLEFFTQGVESQLRPLVNLSRSQSPARLQSLVDSIVGEGEIFDAVFVVAGDGRVETIGLPPRLHHAAFELGGADMSGNPLFQAALAAAKSGTAAAPVWSDRYLSPLAGRHTVGVAIGAGGRVIIGEASLDRILLMLKDAVRREDAATTIIDGNGQWLASSNPDPDPPGRYIDYLGLPEFRAALEGRMGNGKRMNLLGNTLYVSAAVAPRLRWVIASWSPAGWGNYSYRLTVLMIIAGFAGSLLISLALAPLWAARMARPLKALIDRTHGATAGDYASPWPRRGSVAELNQLSRDLGHMVETIQAREAGLVRSEERLRATLESTPSVAVQWYDQSGRVLYWNRASETMYGYAAAEVVGTAIGDKPLMYGDRALAERFVAILQEIARTGLPYGPAEFALRHRDGSEIVVLATIFAIPGEAEGAHQFVCMDVDITDRRRAEHELRLLNEELEARVRERTEALLAANRGLEAVVEELKATQEQLVQSEKLAALGNLVAGVAHELNTPIGNGLLAVTTLADRLAEFNAARAGGLRRSDFENFLSQADAASDIATRNLRRAAELVASFKQVAVDQASDQRRSFDLAEVVREIVMTLQPTFKRTPYRIEVAVPDGIVLDSHPGALGQVLGNLVNNAMLHGFEGRDHGTVRIEATAEPGAMVRLTVRDDGCGIPPERQKRVFDPFFTTKMGKGGSGLGLHICHNIVTHVLGGRISLDSRAGEGTEFVLQLPLCAPARQSAD